MVWGESVSAYCLAVLTCGIACIAVPSVVWVLLVKREHVFVAIGLGQYAGSRYREVFGIALHDGGVGYVVIWPEAVAVDDERLRPHLEAVDGAVHGQYAALQDVEFINFAGRTHPDGPAHGVVLNLQSQLLALMRGELFRVGDEGVGIVGWQDDGSCIDGTCEAASASFVASGFDDIGGVTW